MFKGDLYDNTTKRLIDIIFSVILLILFSPLCLITAVLIKMDNSGPVFADTPERVGKKGHLFKMFKFRSMIVNAHMLLRHDPKFTKLYAKYKKNSYKLKEDPRVTEVGKFMRKHSLD